MMDKSVATIGTFDGVHRGHQAVLSSLASLARERGARPTIFTFRNHPLEVVAPDRAPKRLMSPGAEEAMLAASGAHVVMLDFDLGMMTMSAGEWMRRMRDSYGVTALVMGYDNTFGCDGVEMSINDYRSLAATLGIEVAEAPVVPGVSSTAIREAISGGRIDDACRMLGRHYALEGYVGHGRKLGREIGFPTANVVSPAGRLVPAGGVYAAWVCAGDEGRLPAVVNIGVRPTVSDSADVTVEAHLIGFSGDIYGRPVTVEFASRLRDEMRFPSLGALRERIETDVREARAVLS